MSNELKPRNDFVQVLFQFEAAGSTFSGLKLADGSIGIEVNHMFEGETAYNPLEYEAAADMMLIFMEEYTRAGGKVMDLRFRKALATAIQKFAHGL